MPNSNCSTSFPTENDPWEVPGLLEFIVSVYWALNTNGLKTKIWEGVFSFYYLMNLKPLFD